MHNRVITTGQHLREEVEEVKSCNEIPVRVCEIALTELKRIVCRGNHKRGNADAEHGGSAHFEYGFKEMLFGLAGCDEASVLVLEIGEEEAECRVPAEHIANVVMAHHHKRKGYNVELVSALLDKAFNRPGQNGKKEKPIEPHYVVLIGDRVSGERIHRSKEHDVLRLYIVFELAEIERKGKSAKTDFYADYDEQCLKHHRLGEKANDVGEGACNVVRVNTHKLAAH